MKQSYLLVAASVISLNLFSQNQVTINPKNVHVPLGFDSNDKIEVVVTGNLPDTCHLRPFGKTKINEQKITINMKATRLSSKDTQCIKALVPYMVSVPIGQLNKGIYQVLINDGRTSNRYKELLVEESNSLSIDDFTYANVTQVKKDRNLSKLVIEGYHPSSCMHIQNVKTVENTDGDTIAVLPIVTQTHEICDFLTVPFSYEIPLPSKVSEGIVFHVRKIDGTALNFQW